MGVPRKATPHARCLGIALGLILVTSCGGGSADSTEPAQAPPLHADPIEGKSATRADAARFLAQASFGTTDAEIERVRQLGYAGWIDDQWRQPAFRHTATWDAVDAQRRSSAADGAGPLDVIDGFYTQAVTGRDQLRGRVAFAWSEIFVIAFGNDIVWDHPRGAANFLDMLGTTGLTTYRNLLGAVARHPMMGAYLSHLHNAKGDPATGRVADENFARELMQLFSIGLVELNPDGSPRHDADGRTIATYTQRDVAALARVVTGWSWAGPDTRPERFWGRDTGAADPRRDAKPMQPYPAFHDSGEVTVLGRRIPGGARADVRLDRALDLLAAHPNVGPFIGRQLIQRLVTSNPSPAYVRRVAAVFDDNGQGVRGDIKSVIRAVLLDPDARTRAAAEQPGFGKLREPVLRLTAYLRAFPSHSDSGRWMVRVTGNSRWGLNQMPLNAPSVFNFFRPGFVPPGTLSGSAGLTVPELQITSESSVAGYANYMVSALFDGVGADGADGRATRHDIQTDFDAPAARADDPRVLLDDVARRLTGRAASPALAANAVPGLSAITMPPPGTSADERRRAAWARARAAALMVLVSADFIVQK